MTGMMGDNQDGSDEVVDEGGPLVVTHDQIQLSAKSDSKLNSSDKKWMKILRISQNFSRNKQNENLTYPRCAPVCWQIDYTSWNYDFVRLQKKC